MNTVDGPQETAAKATPSEPLILGGVLAITALVYAAAIRFGFAYDDQGQIVENALVHAWRYVPQYFSGQAWQHLYPNAPINYYRPLNVLWFRVNDSLFGLHPAGWHAVAVLLHVFVTFLTYRIARKLTGRPMVAALSALLFGVHPMRHEVVAWISGTTESLCAALFLLGFLMYLKSCERDRVRWMALSCVFYAAGLLAKETAIVLPAVVFAHAWIFGAEPEGGTRPRWTAGLASAAKIALLYAPVAIGYVVVRVSVLGAFTHSRENLSLGTFALTLPSVVFFYLRQWFLPIWMSPFYDVDFSNSWNAAHFWLPLLGVSLAAMVVWWFRERLGRREAALAAAWLVLTLLPALDLFVFSSGELVHDRYFYLPGFGAALLIALAVRPLATGRLTLGIPQRLLLVTLLFLVPLSYSAATAASHWEDDLVLFQHAHSVAPNNVTVRNNYAIELDRHGDMASAMPMLTGLVEEHPNSWQANYNLGRMWYGQNGWAAAQRYFEKALKIDPTQADTFLQLSLIDMRSNRYDQAERKIRRAIELRPLEPNFHFALGVTLAQRGDCDGARSAFSHALVLKPRFVKASEQMQKCQTQAARGGARPAATVKPTDAGLP